MASWAYKMAVECSHITADVIEVGEFADLRDKYDVATLPRVVFNGSIGYDGGWVAQTFLQSVVKIGDQGSGEGE